MKRSIAVVGVLLAACGGSADPAGVTSSGGSSPSSNLPVAASPKAEQYGTRLRRVWNSANDSSVVPAGYYDKALKTRCAFEQVTNNASLCVPEDVYTLTYKDWNNLYASNNRALFTDSSCKASNVAMLNSSACAQYGVVRVLPDATSTYVNACGGTQASTWYLATPISPGTPLYYYGVPAGGGACCSCQPVKDTPTGATLVKMEMITTSNADKTNLVRAELSVDP